MHHLKAARDEQYLGLAIDEHPGAMRIEHRDLRQRRRRRLVRRPAGGFFRAAFQPVDSCARCSIPLALHVHVGKNVLNVPGSASFLERSRVAGLSDAVVAIGRSIWKRWIGYHRRSLVETKMHCIKRLGERVMSRTFERQVNELHIRAAILNRFTELGRPQTAAVA